MCFSFLKKEVSNRYMPYKMSVLFFSEHELFHFESSIMKIGLQLSLPRRNVEGKKLKTGTKFDII